MASKTATVPRIALCQTTVTKVHTSRAKVSKNFHTAATGVNNKAVSTTAVIKPKLPDVSSQLKSEDTTTGTVVLSQTDTAAVSARVDALTAEGHIILDVDCEAMVHHNNWIPVSTAMAALTKKY